MIRRFAVAAVLISCLGAAGWAQSPPAPAAPVKPAAKKAAPKAKPAAKPLVAAETGPCHLGVIPVLGNQFAVEKFGLTVFETEETEVPVDWGFDDIAFARVRAATGNDPAVRRISYPRNAFDPFYNPQSRLLHAQNETIPAIVQSITANSNCERYLVVTKLTVRLPNSTLELNGIGTYNQGVGSMLRHSHMFANILLTLLDGKSYQKIDRTLAILRHRFSESMRLTEDPLSRLDNSDYPDPPAAASSSALLREKARALVAAQVDHALPTYLNDE